jgi:hypothetical protein
VPPADDAEKKGDESVPKEDVKGEDLVKKTPKSDKKDGDKSKKSKKEKKSRNDGLAVGATGESGASGGDADLAGVKLKDINK